MNVWDSRPLRALGVVTAASMTLFVVDLLGGPAGGGLPGWSLLVVSAVLGVVVCARIGRSALVTPAAARYWRTTAWALGVIGLSMLGRTADPFLPGSVAAASDALHGLGALLLVWALARLPIAGRGRSGRIALAMDLSVVVSAAAVFLWHFAGWQALRVASAGAALPTIGMMVAWLTAIFLVTKVSLTGSETLSRGALRMIGLSYVTGGVGAAVTTALADRPGLNVLLLINPLATLLLAIGSRHQLVDTGSSVPAGTRSRPRYSLMPYVAVAAVDALLLWVLARDEGDTMVVSVFAVALTGLVIGRQMVVFRENDSLVDRLDAGLAELRDKERRFRLLVQNSTDVVTITDPEGRTMYMSPAITRVLGGDPEAMVGTISQVHPDDADNVYDRVMGVVGRPGASVTYQARLQHADGSWRWFEMTSADMTHEPSVGGMVTNSRDITETRHVQDRLSHEATHDALTGLANRVLFGNRIERSVASADPEHRMSIVLVDLDGFKAINDTMGHAAGDALLIAVADRMRAGVRPTDTVARLGGDEFAILFEGLGGDDVDRVLVRIAESLLVPVTVEHDLISVRASFGVVEGRAGDDPESLLRQADVAMYEAKERGLGGHERYRPGMEDKAIERRRQALELQAAIDGDQLVLHYQPVVSLPGRELLGVEALVRWEHPERGLLGPGAFVPVAEENGLIVPLGRWVMREAVRQGAEWIRTRGPDAPGTIAVNVSACQLQEHGFAAEVAQALGDSGMPADRLIIEITESTAVGGGATAENLRAIRRLGIRLSLDDFGTGTSTLSLLIDCPVDQIKLDRSFVPGPDSDVIAGAVLHLARGLGIEAVAEGVETAEQADQLHAMGYDRAQGFHFARPMPATALFTQLSGRR